MVPWDELTERAPYVYDLVVYPSIWSLFWYVFDTDTVLKLQDVEFDKLNEILYVIEFLDFKEGNQSLNQLALRILVQLHYQYCSLVLEMPLYLPSQVVHTLISRSSLLV